MNKKFTRLTALLLAMLLLTSTFGAALADTSLTRGEYNQALTQMQEDLNLIPEDAEITKRVTVTGTKLVPVTAAVDGELAVDGSIVLTNSETTVEAYQWQIEADGVWANIAGETGASLKLTYAMALNALTEENGVTVVKVRRLLYDAEGVLLEICDTFDVPVGDDVVYNTQEGDVTVREVTEYTEITPSEQEKFDTAWAFQDTANGRVSTFALTREGDAPETDTPVLRNYSIVISYVFEDDTTAAEPYTATIIEGSNLDVTVRLPVVQGYLAYVDSAETSSTVIELKIENIKEDKNITVVYKPTDVEYKVIHYQQNVDNDDYTQVWIEQRQGETKSYVPEVSVTKRTEPAVPEDIAEKFEGFYSLLYEKPEIAADGSTEVEVYYDRGYYLMQFELGGGDGVEPIYARYGSQIGEIKDPTRAGYSFAGWVDKDGAEATIPATMPAANTTYTATWKPETTSYSVVYWFENADSDDANDPDNYSHVHVATIENVPTESTVNSDSMTDITDLTVELLEDAKHFTRYTNTSGELQSAYTVEGDGSTIVNVYYTRKEYTVRFYYARRSTAGTGNYYISTGNNPGRLGRQGWTSGSTSAPQIKEKYQDMLGSMTNGSYTYYYMDLTAKYNADISDKWPDELYEEAYNRHVLGSWFMHENSDFYANMGTQKSYKGLYVRMDDDIITNSATDDPFLTSEIDNYCMAFWSTSPSEYTVYVYYDAIEGEDIPEGTATKTYDGKTYILQYSYVSLSNSGMYTPDALIGVNSDKNAVGQIGGTGVGSNNYVVEFYYSRLEYPLTYMSNGDEDWETYVPYGAKMSNEDYANHVPATTPANMSFAGWYTTKECIAGTEYKFAQETMPANGVILYAKWVPVPRTVSFYLTEEEMKNGTSSIEADFPTITVPHGTIVTQQLDEPKNGAYKFIGWFYQDENGNEKAFDFNNMRVTRDMQVYGKWSSDVLKRYTVYFKYATDSDVNGNPTDGIEIAAPITGSTLAGLTKTFAAKGGTELYPAYQENYFPLVQSHSMTINIEHEDNQGDNTFTFWYVPADAVPYKVYYVAETLKDDATSTDYGTTTIDGKTYHIIAATKEVNDNHKAVVTEQFAAVDGYMPDAYQKRLVLDADESSKNVIVFYYTVDSTHAYYKITHYTRNTDSKTWTEYASSQLPGTIGDTYSASPLEISGFYYDSTEPETVTSGELKAEGLELKLYYERSSYPYEVRYLELSTGEQVALPKTEDEQGNPLTGLFGTVVTEGAIAIDGYTAVAPTSKDLTIRIDAINADTGSPELNIITFYYVEDEVTIDYVVVGPNGCGTVSPTRETVKVKSETAQGSTAAASSNNYKFVGWFTDEACTKPVDASWVTNSSDSGAEIKPQKADGKNVAATYYAKFELNVADLTIEKNFASDADADPNATFLFHVTGPNNYEADVVIKGAGSVTIKDLLIGEYTVTEDENWSWRYAADDAEQTVMLQAGGSTVTFTNDKDKEQWLDGNAYAENEFKDGTVTDISKTQND